MDLLLNAPPHHSLLDTEHRRLAEAMDDLSRGCSVYWVLFDISTTNTIYMYFNTGLYHLHVLYRVLPFTCTLQGFTIYMYFTGLQPKAKTCLVI